MSVDHNGGNILNAINLEEHDGAQNAKRVSIVSGSVGQATINIAGSATIYAVVNTSAAGDSVSNIGFATVAISNPTLYAVVNTSAAGVGNSMVTINPRTDYFGLVSVSGNVAVSSLPALVASNSNIGSVSVLGGVINTNLNTGANYVGLVSVNGSVVNLNGTNNIGSVSVLGGTINSVLQTSTLNVGSVSILGGVINTNLNTGVNYIGLVSINGSVVNLAGVNAIGFATVYNATSANYIGLMSVNIGGIAAGTNYIGLMSVSGSVVNLTGTNNIGSVSVLGGVISLQASTLNIGSVSVLGGSIVNSAGPNFIGLVTAWSRNAGSAKTLVSLPIAFAVASIATIAIPATNLSVNITNLVIGSNATTQLRIKSGVTY